MSKKKGCHASIIYQSESKGMPSVVSHKACVRFGHVSKLTYLFVQL